jgi:hypothetical protein
MGSARAAVDAPTHETALQYLLRRAGLVCLVWFAALCAVLVSRH